MSENQIINNGQARGSKIATYIIIGKVILGILGVITGIGIGIYLYNKIRIWLSKNPIKNPFSINALSDQLDLMKYDSPVLDDYLLPSSDLNLTPVSDPVEDAIRSFEGSLSNTKKQVSDVATKLTIPFSDLASKVVKLDKPNDGLKIITTNAKKVSSKIKLPKLKLK
jgi:hypothetical protein